MHQDPQNAMSGYAARLSAACLDRVAYQIGLSRRSNDPKEEERPWVDYLKRLSPRPAKAAATSSQRGTKAARSA